MSTELTKFELEEYSKRLTRLKRWKDDTIQAGIDLAYIRNSKCYRGNYDTFEEFCEKEFSMHQSKAYRLIDFAGIKTSPIGEEIQNEGQSREISKVPEEHREEVLKRAKDSGSLTAKSISKASRMIDAEIIEVDHTEAKYKIPKGILADWQRADEIGRDLLKRASEMKVILERGKTEDDPIFREVTISAYAYAQNLYTYVKAIIPHAVCTSCQGRNNSKCTTCKGRGFFSKDFYDRAIPEEIKTIRLKASK